MKEIVTPNSILGEDANKRIVLPTDIDFQPRVPSRKIEGGEINYYYGEEAKSYWNGEPPQLILATGSLRKALMWFIELNGLVYPGDQGNMPKGFNDHLRRINNGDGVLQVGDPVMLGYYEGAEVWVESQDGETEGNNPVEQARNKVLSLLDKYKGKNVMILAGDTVGESFDGVQYGKPNSMSDDYNEEDYIRDWLDSGSVNVNGLAVLDCWTGDVEVERLEIATDTNGAVMDNLSVDMHAGEGGLSQQVVKWDEMFPGWRDNPSVYLEMMQHACQYAGATPMALLELAISLRLKPRNTFEFDHFDEEILTRDSDGRVTHVKGIPVDPRDRKARASIKTNEVFGTVSEWPSIGSRNEGMPGGVPGY
jgi:hypothetical protein